MEEYKTFLLAVETKVACLQVIVQNGLIAALDRLIVPANEAQGKAVVKALNEIDGLAATENAMVSTVQARLITHPEANPPWPGPTRAG
jgi:hypothetical protein